MATEVSADIRIDDGAVMFHPNQGMLLTVTHPLEAQGHPRFAGSEVPAVDLFEFLAHGGTLPSFAEQTGIPEHQLKDSLLYAHCLFDYAARGGFAGVLKPTTN